MQLSKDDRLQHDFGNKSFSSKIVTLRQSKQADKQASRSLLAN